MKGIRGTTCRDDRDNICMKESTGMTGRNNTAFFRLSPRITGMGDRISGLSRRERREKRENRLK